MKIALINFFPFRPHVEHMFYLGEQLKKANHEVVYLSCKGALGSCYNLAIKGNAAFSCAKCRVGGLESFVPGDRLRFVDDYIDRSEPDKSSPYYREMVKSSSYTLTRIERSEDLEAAKVIGFQDELEKGAFRSFSGVRRFIEEEGPEFVFVFNGRMDVLRGAVEAAKSLDTPFACVERTWFGHGVQLNFSGNALSLVELRKVTDVFQSKPLTKKQAISSASFICSRFLKTNELEWRKYNEDSVNYGWPKSGGDRKRILILPSSKNEQLSHPDWESGISDYLEAFKVLLKKLPREKYSVVLRGHPNWAENIGIASGKSIEEHYLRWCEENDVEMLGSSSKQNTCDLIRSCDHLILNGSSAAYEAGFLGKKITCVGSCHYSTSGIADVYLSEDELERFSPEADEHDRVEVIRKTLRFVYSFAHRYALFQRSIKANSTTDYSYSSNFDMARLERMMESGHILFEDEEFAEEQLGEDEVVGLIESGDWSMFQNLPSPVIQKELNLGRKGLFRYIDSIRNLLPRGDR